MINGNKIEDYPDVLSVQDVYAILPVGMNKVRDMIRDGIISSRKIGNRYIISKKALINFLNCAA